LSVANDAVTQEWTGLVDNQTDPRKWNAKGGVLMAIVFATGLILGFGLGSVTTRTRVVFSGAMSGLEDRPFLGPEDALVTNEEYTDYECVFCQRY